MAINPNLHKKTRAQKFAAIAFIFGVVILLLSGLCTLGFEVNLLVNPPQSNYDRTWLTFGRILAFGAMGFIPAGLLILLALYTKKHGGTIWRLIIMSLIMAIFVYVIIAGGLPLFFTALR